MAPTVTIAMSLCDHKKNRPTCISFVAMINVSTNCENEVKLGTVFAEILGGMPTFFQFFFYTVVATIPYTLFLNFEVTEPPRFIRHVYPLVPY